MAAVDIEQVNVYVTVMIKNNTDILFYITWQKNTIKITGKSAIGQHRIVCRMIRSLLLESTQFSDLIGMLLRDLKSGE